MRSGFRMRALRVAAWCWMLIAGAAGAPLEHDLGGGLEYVRLRALPADLPRHPTTARMPPCVVDVRYVKAAPAAAQEFLAWIAARASRRSPVFVVANADTEAALIEPLTSRPRTRGVVVVGIPGRGFAPHVPVASTAQNERRAYEALERGAPILSLLKDNPDKVRNDEESLSRDRLAEASAEAADEALAGPSAAAARVDAALQRAVHLHRALVALRKL